MVSNPPLKKPPLQEAVFEIRFPTVQDYALLAGGMAVSHKNDFQVVEKLESAEFPVFVQVLGLVKHRFSTEDRRKLFQTGADVISVNIINYEGFNSFRDDIKSILSSSENFGVILKNPQRISLRYINRFKSIKNPSLTLNIQPPFPNKNFDNTRFLQIREVEDIGNDGILVNTVFHFPVDETDLILDIDAFFENPGGEWDIEMILAWTTKAHDIIWHKFTTLVSESEMESRK